MEKKKIILLICIILITIQMFMTFIIKIDVEKYTIKNKKIPEEFNNFKITEKGLNFTIPKCSVMRFVIE